MKTDALLKIIFKLFLSVIAACCFINAAIAQAPNITYASPQSFKVNKTIQPLTPVNSGGNVPANAYAQVITLAGSGSKGYADGTGKAAMFNNPISVFADPSGGAYVADRDNNVIRKISYDGVVTTLAGNGSPGAANGLGSLASFKGPSSITAGDGNFYVADTYNNLIRKVTAYGAVTTFTGTGAQGSTDGNISIASFSQPTAITFDNAGNMYIAEFAGRIRKITHDGIVSTFAGNGSSGFADGKGTAALFKFPSGLATDASGNVYVADSGNGLVRKITPDGTVTTIAGKNGQHYSSVGGVAVDPIGNIYFSDPNGAIYMIDPSGLITPLAGGNSSSTVDGIGTNAQFSFPEGLSIDGYGHLYVADFGSSSIRKIFTTGYTIDKPLPEGLTFDLATGTISGTPVVLSPATDYKITAYNKEGKSSFTISIAVVNGTSGNIDPPNIDYQTPQNYTVSQTIAPLVPTNTGGPVPVTFFSRTNTLAGKGTPGNTDGTAITSAFNFPEGVAFDSNGRLYVADYNNNEIRRVDGAGNVITLAGNGAASYINGTGKAAAFNQPSAVAVDGADNIYVADRSNNVIRKITPDGNVTTFAGSGIAGSTDGAAANATFHFPTGLAFDNSGNLYVADNGNNVIRKISPAGLVSTFSGNGSVGYEDGIATSASFKNPQNLVFDAAGNLYVTDAGNNLIRKITPDGTVSTYAGNRLKASTDGPLTSASFDYPWGIVTDKAGNIFVSEQFGNKVRMITPDGFVSTLAGSGTAGSLNNDGVVAKFWGPAGMTINADGVLYIAEKNGNLIRTIVTTGYHIDKALPAGLDFDTSTGIISGTPNIPSPPTEYTITGYNEGGKSSKTIIISVSDVGPSVLPPHISYPTPQVYTTTIPIQPLVPTNTGGPVPNVAFGEVKTIAGNGIAGFFNGTGAAAGFNNPASIAVDAAGNLIVVEEANQDIRKVTPQGVTTRIAGSGQVGSADGPANAATFNGPVGVVIDNAGNIYVSDTKNNKIRKITPAGVVSTFAGTGVAGNTDGPGASATFSEPEYLAIDKQGNIYVADDNNNAIRKITPFGIVSTIATNVNSVLTNGTYIPNKGQFGIAIDQNGNIYIAETGNNVIKKMTPDGNITFFSGSGIIGNKDGDATTARFSLPIGIVADYFGGLYITDNNEEIRRVDQNGNVTTIAGTGSEGFKDGIGKAAYTNGVSNLTIDKNGTIYFADEFNHAIRSINATGYTIDKPLPDGLVFDPTTGIITGTPTTPSPATDYTVTAYNLGGSSSFVINITVIKHVVQAQTITFPPLAPATYGDPDIEPGALSSNNAIPLIYSSDNPSVAEIVNNKIHIKGVGTANITAGQPGDSDHESASPVSQIFTVNPAPLIITANNVTRPQQVPNPVLTVTYSGFVYGENESVLNVQPFVTTTATINSAPGNYPIVVSGAEAANYVITYVNGLLTIVPEITIPNAFTPNGDGINDKWNIPSLAYFPDCLVTVFNRYGTLVYQSRGYQKAWDGTVNNSLLPTGTYYYIIDMHDGKSKQLTGSLAIIR